MNLTDNYVIKETISIFEFTKKIMHMSNALLTDMLMLCNREVRTKRHYKLKMIALCKIWKY